MSTPRNRISLLFAALTLTVACGDYGGGTATTTSSGGGGGGGGISFSGGADSMAAFSQTAFPILRAECNDCHSGEGPGSPSIAHADLQTAYEAVTFNRKVNMNDPPASRLVRRLASDFHYCWSSCVENGAEMNAAVTAWADAVRVEGGGTVVEEAILSRSLGLGDGVEAEGQERYAGGLVALWEFKEGERGWAHDTSGVEPPADLAVQNVNWLSSYGIEFVEDNAWAVATKERSRKMYDQIADPTNGTQQYSLEAWVVPNNIEQGGPKNIMTYQDFVGESNFKLGQEFYAYEFRNRTVEANTDEMGMPTMETGQDAQLVEPEGLQHLVLTYDQYRGRRIYIDGAFVGLVDGLEPGRLWNWSPEFNFILGNVLSQDDAWQGQLRLAAVYKYALTDAQIQQNLRAGVGKRLLLRFDISDWGVAGGFIEFIVTEFDEYSYLFCQPTVVAPEVGFRISNLRIKVNDEIPVTGQAFMNVDETVTGTGQELSRLCSIIPKQNGAEFDLFAIDFEYLGAFENPIAEEIFDPPPPGEFGDPLPIEGLRNFDRINATMAAVTGVDFQDDELTVKETYDEIKLQLPGGNDVRTFSSAQQIGVSKLALEYCDALVEKPLYRDAFFDTGIDWTADADPYFTVAGNRTFLADRLHQRMIGNGVETLPSQDEVRSAVDTLVTDLLGVCATEACGPTRTATIVKGACAAVLASAGASIH